MLVLLKLLMPLVNLKTLTNCMDVNVFKNIKSKVANIPQIYAFILICEKLVYGQIFSFSDHGSWISIM